MISHPSHLFEPREKDGNIIQGRLRLGTAHQHAYAPPAVGLLRARGERPCNSRTAKSANELSSSDADCHLPGRNGPSACLCWESILLRTSLQLAQSGRWLMSTSCSLRTRRRHLK